MAAIDFIIVFVYLAGVVAVGAWFSRRQKTTKQYFTASGRVPWWAVAASIVATETSAVTFISIPGAAYARNGNFTFLQLALGYIAGRIVISALFIPKYFQGEILTVYQLLSQRFGNGVKAVLASFFVVMRTAADGIRLLLTAGVLAFVWKAFAPETDMNVAVAGSIVAMGLLMIVFTLWGGMEAVIWIEVGQLCIYLFGAGAAAWTLISRVDGGLAGALETAGEYNKTAWTNFSLTLDQSAGHTFWAGVIGGCFLTMSTHGTDQYLVQRYLCVDSPKRAAAALLSSGVVVFLQFALFLTIGVLLFSFYRPFESAGYATGAAAAPFTKNDEVFTDFITQHLPPGAGGLVVAAILAAALSSSLNSIAATAVNDLIRPFFVQKADAFYLKLSKILTALAGIAQIAVALAMRDAQSSALDGVLKIAGLLNGPVLGIFLLGAWVRGAGKLSAAIALAAGAAAAIYVWQYTNIFWPWYAAMGALAALAAGFVMSKIAPNK
ncbi:MAG: sodium:solute symporter family transporter [Planctomycetota bacterium]